MADLRRPVPTGGEEGVGQCTHCGRHLWDGIPYFQLELVSPYAATHRVYYCSEACLAAHYVFREDEEEAED